MEYEEKSETNLHLSTWVNSYVNVVLKTIIDEENTEGQLTIRLKHPPTKYSGHKEISLNKIIADRIQSRYKGKELSEDEEKAMELFVTFFVRDVILRNAVQQIIDEDDKKGLLGESLMCSENPMEDYIRYRLRSIYGTAVDDTVLQFVLDKLPKNAKWTETFQAMDSLLIHLENKHKLEKTQNQTGRISSTIAGKMKAHVTESNKGETDIDLKYQEMIDKDQSVQGDSQPGAAKDAEQSSPVDNEIDSATKQPAGEDTPQGVDNGAAVSDKTERKPSRQRQLLTKARNSFARFWEMFE